MQKNAKKHPPFRKKSLQLLRYGIQTGFLLASALSLLYLDYTLIAVIMAVSFLGGAWFCGWACPFGSAQDWLALLGKRLFKWKLKIPYRIDRFVSLLRYVMLVLSLAGFGYTAFLSRPYQNFNGLLAGHTAYMVWGAWILLAGFLLSSLVIDRPFCRYFCLEGARYGFLSLFRVFSIKRNGDTCITCRACDRVCPSGIRVSAHSHVRHPACFNCMKCITACPEEGCLKYTFFWERTARKTGEKKNEIE